MSADERDTELSALRTALAAAQAELAAERNGRDAWESVCRGVEKERDQARAELAEAYKACAATEASLATARNMIASNSSDTIKALEHERAAALLIVIQRDQAERERDQARAERDAAFVKNARLQEMLIEAEQARDRAVKERDDALGGWDTATNIVESLTGERDRAVAEGQRLREALTEAAERFDRLSVSLDFEGNKPLRNHAFNYAAAARAALSPTPATGRGET